MNAGVSIVPRGKVMRPRRAAPSVFNRSKDIRLIVRVLEWAGTRSTSRCPWRVSTRSSIRHLGYIVAREQQHRITIGKEPVALTNRVLVRGKNAFLARKRRYQHQ